MLRRWVMTPLTDQYKINQRLDALEDLDAISFERNKVMDAFKRIPDLEKSMNRLYHYAVKTSASRAVYFEDVNTSKLKEFKELMIHFETIWNQIGNLRKHFLKLTSRRLKQLITVSNEDTKNYRTEEECELFFEDLNENSFQ
eukprot:GHVR01001123.1.p1 GENE.GHVR01001123.1~~GHVR01001123.1.p1  ORF type:complete len:142 (+),score=11.50 GHVR01001123.1:1-426(+)